MDTKALKQKILDLAIRGKLVPQDPNDEPASVLLEKIRAEKMQMVKDGKLKPKDLKNDTVIFVGEDNLHYEKFSDGTVKNIEEEIAFKLIAIPKNWEWVRLGTVFKHNTGKALNSANRTGELLEYITTSNLYWDRFELKNLKKMYFTNSELDKCTVSKGDLLVCEGGDIGRAAIWNYDYDIRIQNHIHKLRPYVSVCVEFFYYLFLFYKSCDLIGGKGIGLQGLSSNALHVLLFPLPPIKEQYRIVSVLNSIFQEIDSIYERRNELNLLIKQTKSKILDLAIRGKLVHQNPSDEPASVLLERIRQEKEELIKAGKLKRDKRESVIFRGEDNSYYEKFSDGTIKCIDEELPFKSPKNWVWCELQDCCSKEIKRGRAPKYADEGDVLAFAQKCNQKTGEIDISTALWIDRASINRYSSDEYMLDGDIVINSTGTGTLGRIGIYHNNDNPHHIPIVPDSHVTMVRAAKNIEPSYLLFCLKVMQRKIENMGEGSTNQKELKPLTIQKIRLPIPPYEEQQRIVNFVHSILKKLSSIEDSLTLSR